MYPDPPFCYGEKLKKKETPYTLYCWACKCYLYDDEYRQSKTPHLSILEAHEQHPMHKMWVAWWKDKGSPMPKCDPTRHALGEDNGWYKILQRLQLNDDLSVNQNVCEKFLYCVIGTKWMKILKPVLIPKNRTQKRI